MLFRSKLQHLGGYGNLALNVIGHNDNGIFVLGNELQGAVLTLKYRSELVIVTLVENLAIYFSRLFKTASTGHQQASTDDIATVSPLLYGSCYDFILQRVVKKNKIIGKATYTNPQIFIIFRCLLCIYQVFF